MSVFANGGWKERWVLSYIFDYAVIIIMIGGFSLLDTAYPYNQPFSLDNISLQYPMADPERVPAVWAGVIACLFPMVVIVLWTLFIDGLYSHHKPRANRSRIMGRPWTLDDRLWEMNCGILGLGLSVAFAICITGVLKNTTGKPRPDIIARCQPDPSIKLARWELATTKICKGDKHLLKDGFKSWPSGHSSISFAGLGYLAVFLAGKLHVFDSRGEVWKTAIVLIPLLAASLVTVSRIMDARHHPFDVISGSLLGILSAWVSYRQYFPSLSHPELKGRAYPHRTWGTDTQDVASVGGSGLYTTAYNPRSLEDGFGSGNTPNNGSSESIGSENGASRKRGPRISISKNASRSRTFEPVRDGGDYEMDDMQHNGGPSNTSSVLPRPPPHMQQITDSTESKDGVDMDETRRSEGLSENPRNNMGLGRLSPPPPQQTGMTEIKA